MFRQTESGFVDFYTTAGRERSGSILSTRSPQGARGCWWWSYNFSNTVDIIQRRCARFL